jgi:FkbM family methyltransferase
MGIPTVKPRGLAYLLGFRPGPRTYGFEVRVFDLPREGRVEYAQWLHPGEGAKTITQASADELRTFLRPGDVAIDIGAHTGDSTIPIALAVGTAGCVLALEPNRFVFPVLAKNAQLNQDKTRIVPLMFAATPEDGEFEFEYSDPGFCNGGRHEGIGRWRHAHAFRLPVAGRNLDSYLRRECPDLLPRIKYIKVDTEGYDLTVLTTLSSLIAERRPHIKAEVYKHSNRTQRESLLRFFKERRYAVHRIASESDYRAGIVETEDLMKWRHFDVFCAPVENRPGG